VTARAPLAETLVAAFRAGLAALDPVQLVARALPDAPEVPGRVALLAVGKAALAMARGAHQRWPDRIHFSLVVTTAAQLPPPLPLSGVAPPEGRVGGAAPFWAAGPAGHPVPDERSVGAAEAALEMAHGLREGDLLLALISGGASALLAAPPPGVSLADKRALVAAMIDAGAPIQDINLVRRHLSRVKGGRLAAAAAPATVFSLILGDVVGGQPHDIGSGPTVPDPTRVDEARAALARWAPRLTHLAPALGESLDPTAAADRVHHRILADPDALATEIAHALRLAGLAARTAPAEPGDAADMATRRAAQAAALRPGDALVIPCEPTLALPDRRGAGGRCGWIALSTLRALRALPPDIAFLCAASDGVDGSSGAAGAIVTRADAERIDPTAIDAALAAFDDAAVHRALGTHLGGGPTGHNLTDVHVLARAPG